MENEQKLIEEKNESDRLACELGEQLEKTQDQLYAVILENKALKKQQELVKIEVPSQRLNDLKACLSFLIGQDGESVPIDLFCKVLKTVDLWGVNNGKKIFFVTGSGNGKTQ